MEGFEPSTIHLTGGYSTAELHSYIKTTAEEADYCVDVVRML